MWHRLVFLLFLIGLAYGAVWLADRPGAVTVDWQGYHVETSFALVVGAIALAVAVLAVFYRGWIHLIGWPARIRQKMVQNRYQKGYLALTRGLVAVAAGDDQGVRDQAWRVEKYLTDPPLPLLLSAQAAQLAGDEPRATRFFRRMLENSETEFFGLRGLITQAIKRGDLEEARLLSERAREINPRSPWVADNLLGLQARAGRWDDARTLLGQAAKAGLQNREETKRRQAVVEFELGAAKASSGDKRAANKHLARSLDLRPGFVPAAARRARLMVDEGKVRKAAAEIEGAWRLNPHPSLFDIFCAARKAANPLDRVKAAQRLLKIKPGHTESHFVAGRAALEAGLWGEARKHLGNALETGESARVYRLLAAVEEAEPDQGDSEQAREWLVRASLADPDPAWVCSTCGGVQPDWIVLCPSCGGFDSLEWKTPPHFQPLAATLTAPALPSPEPAKSDA